MLYCLIFLRNGHFRGLFPCVPLVVTPFDLAFARNFAILGCVRGFCSCADFFGVSSLVCMVRWGICSMKRCNLRVNRLFSGFGSRVGSDVTQVTAFKWIAGQPVT